MSSINLKNGFSQASFDNLMKIASQVKGHNIGEGTSGGRGYMGIMKKADGTLSVFKCLTHPKEYNAFEKDMYPEFGDELKDASDNLGKMLRRLGKEAHVDMDKFENILTTYSGKENYLSRKMVAKAVNEIVKCVLSDADAKKFWDKVQFAGTVDDTSLKKKSPLGGDSVEFTSNEDSRNISLLKEVKAMDNVGDALPASIEDLKTRIVIGDFGKEMNQLLNDAMGQIEANCPSAKECFNLSSTWMFNDHKEDFYGHRTLAEPKDLLDRWEQVKLKLFKAALMESLNYVKNKLEQNHKTDVKTKDIMILFRRAYIRAGYAFAGLNTACKIAEDRKIKCLFEDRLMSPQLQDDIIKRTLKTVNDKFDHIENKYNLEGVEAARQCLAGEYFDNKVIYDDEKKKKNSADDAKAKATEEEKKDYEIFETKERDKGAIKDIVSKSVAFIYSELKTIEGNSAVEFSNDDNKHAMTSDIDYKFNIGKAGDSRNGDEIANGMFD